MSDTPRFWTLDELTEQVEQALESAELEQPSGRVRQVPDGRTIRYYTTLGILDRPVGVRNRRRLYGERHLQQLLAIKRLQAEGLTLAQIQQRLVGIDADALAALTGRAPTEAPAVERGEVRRFWRSAPTPAAPDTALDEPAPAPRLVTGLELQGGVTVLFAGVERTLDERARRELIEAAAPLVAAARRLGLSRRGDDEEG